MASDLRTRTGLAYDDLGPTSGSPAEPPTRAVVLVHAGICDRRMWDSQLESLSARRRLVRLDLRGFGTSDRRAPGEFAHYLEVAGLLDELGLRSAHLVGGSMAAGVVTEVALARPELAGSLLLVAPSGALRTELTPDLEAFWEAEAEALQEADLDRAVEANLETWLDGPGQPSDRVAGPVRAFVGQMQLKAFENRDGWEDEEIEGGSLLPPIRGRAGEVRVPTLILSGDLDVAAVGQTAARLAEEVPGASLVRWPDVAHLPSLERPDDFNRLAADWFDRVEGGSGPA